METIPRYDIYEKVSKCELKECPRVGELYLDDWEKILPYKWFNPSARKDKLHNTNDNQFLNECINYPIG